MLAIATSDDLQEVCDLLRVMHAENGVGRVNETKALGVITQTINAGHCLITRDQGQVVGSMGLYRSQWWYSDDPVFFDQWFFVHPKHRSSGHALRLISAMKAISAQNKTPFVLSVGTTVDTLEKLRFFRKHLQPFGGSFVYLPDVVVSAA